MPSRRPHVNSHHGCVQCKARKIKCDETHPTCQKCRRRGIPCSKQENSISSAASSRSASPIHVNHFQNDPAIVTRTVSRPLLSSPISAPIIQLVHHYVVHTAPTFCDHPFLLPLWQDAIPVMAFANPYLLHSVAALSSMHLAHLYPASESPTHIQAAFRHQDAALKLIQPQISNISTQNASAIFVSAALVSIFGVASRSPHLTPLLSVAQRPTLSSSAGSFNTVHDGDRGGHYNPWLPLTQASATRPARAIDGIVNINTNSPSNPNDGNDNNNGNGSNSDFISQLQTILHLFRGIVAVLDVSADRIRNGPIALLIQTVAPPSTTASVPYEIEEVLDRAHALCNSSNASTPAVASLRDAFRSVGTARGRFGAVFRWACTVDDGFLAALGRGDECALVVVALYGVLLYGLEAFWWTRGWGSDLVVAVQGVVRGREARDLLAWARARVGCR